ncbi:hypothetical protein HPB52_018213 [Rhipicephalus sanguineus]|uniref:Uncharacterized protein n=1 Tax=Rhipicephalus sanguineus TaxID=34632 RepID=A0A9D4PJG4_RHISA|nr:hypothetical protein HPB52_018213 [Rhipicephalus sanguineus]
MRQALETTNYDSIAQFWENHGVMDKEDYCTCCFSEWVLLIQPSCYPAPCSQVNSGLARGRCLDELNALYA